MYLLRAACSCLCACSQCAVILMTCMQTGMQQGMLKSDSALFIIPDFVQGKETVSLPAVPSALGRPFAVAVDGASVGTLFVWRQGETPMISMSSSSEVSSCSTDECTSMHGCLQTPLPITLCEMHE